MLDEPVSLAAGTLALESGGAAAPPTPAWRRYGDRSLSATKVIAALLGVVFAGAFLSSVFEPAGFLMVAMLPVALLTPYAVYNGFRSLGAMLRSDSPVPGEYAVFVALFPVLGGGILTLLEAAVVGSAFARGRQLRRLGKVLLPKVEGGDAWTQLPLAPQVEPELCSALAAQWRENGRTEHASVAAFARLTLDLMALGAPPRLIHAANRDARDEIRHTELCFSLAKALDGRDASPGAFPEAQRAQALSKDRSRALASLAVDSLIDGALREGVSARVIAQLVKRCSDAATREVLREIAADEGRHSAHGWEVVEWCLAEGGEPVAMALRGAMALLPRSHAPSTPPAAQDGSWERFGIHGHELESGEHADAMANLARRVEELSAGFRNAA